MQADGCSPASTCFLYDEAQPDVAKFLKGQAERIRRYASKCIVVIGKDLIAAKHYLSHGAFIRWVEYEVGIPARTAQGYMKVAQWTAGKSASVAHLPPAVLYVLSATSTPTEFANEILRRIEAGERIALPTIRAELRRQLAVRLPAAHAESAPRMRDREPDVGALLVDAVSIMTRGLSRADFVRVRDIMINTHLLGSPDLAHHMVAAFSLAAARNGEEHPMRRLSIGIVGPREDEPLSAQG